MRLTARVLALACGVALTVTLAPASAAQFIQGLETLAVRITRQEQTARTVAEHLARHPSEALQLRSRFKPAY